MEKGIGFRGRHRQLLSHRPGPEKPISHLWKRPGTYVKTQDYGGAGWVASGAIHRQRCPVSKCGPGTERWLEMQNQPHVPVLWFRSCIFNKHLRHELDSKEEKARTCSREGRCGNINQWESAEWARVCDLASEAMQAHQTAEHPLTWGWEGEEQEEGKKNSEGTQPWKENFKWLSADSDATAQY